MAHYLKKYIKRDRETYVELVIEKAKRERVTDKGRQIQRERERERERGKVPIQ